jgi:uridine phosphorylase
LENCAPILEFDPERAAIINPKGIPLEGDPHQAVVCFFQDVIQKLKEEDRLTQVGSLHSEMGEHPLYLLKNEGVVVFHPGVGAPLATGILEEVIADRIDAFIVCGGCGVLQREIAAGHPVVLTSAVRDEGTSYHYLPAGREVAAHPDAVAALQAVLSESGIEFMLGKAWTTDAFYRETPARRALRLAEGCSVVEMEAAALFAVAQFRGVRLGQVVYGGDLVIPEGWDFRDWNNRKSIRELLFDLSVAAVRRLI